LDLEKVYYSFSENHECEIGNPFLADQ